MSRQLFIDSRFAQLQFRLAGCAVACTITCIALFGARVVSAQNAPPTVTAQPQMLAIIKQLKADASALLGPISTCSKLVSAYELLGSTLYYAEAGKLSAQFKTAINAERSTVSKLFDDNACGGASFSSGVSGIGRGIVIPTFDNRGAGTGGGGSVKGRRVSEFVLAYSILSTEQQQDIRNVLSSETLAELDALTADDPLGSPVDIGGTLRLLRNPAYKQTWKAWSLRPDGVELSQFGVALKQLQLRDPATLKKLQIGKP